MADLSMIARRQVRLACLAALTGPQFAGIKIQSPGDWSTPAETVPSIQVRASECRKESVNVGQPEFLTTITVDFDLRVGERNDEAAQDAIEALCYTVEQAILAGYDLIRIINQVASVDTKVEYSSEGKLHFGAARMSFGFQLPEMFEPVIDQALLEIGLHFDAGDPFDPNGNYSNPLFPATPAPRTSGPDGRDEGALNIILPQ